MGRKIILEFPDADIEVSATVLDQEEPDLCDTFWKNLETPLKMACQNTLSTGDLFLGWPRPPKHPVKVGTQANPIGRKGWLLTRLDPGMIIYSGVQLFVAYGPDITEPLLAGGSVVAMVDKEDLYNLMKAGKSVWNAQYMRHRLVTMTVRRKEG